MRRVLAILIVLALNVGTAAVARADDGVVGYNGGGTQPGPLTPKQIALARMKSQFAHDYLAFRKAGGAASEYPGGLVPLERALNEGKPFRAPNASADASSPNPYAYPGNRSSATLASAPFQSEDPNYNCGPASAWAALSAQGTGNNHFGDPLTQPNLGASIWLNTDPVDGTVRGSNWLHTLNSWIDGTDPGWYELTNYPGFADAADIASKFNLDIDTGFEPIMNVWMSSARGYLPGWNSTWGTVYHYVPGYGYDQYGDYLNFIEVFASVGAGYKSGTPKETWGAIEYGMGIIW